MSLVVSTLHTLFALVRAGAARVAHPARRVVVATRRAGGEAGQTTAEYALVLLGAAALAGLLMAWASDSGAIARLFDAVLRRITRDVG
jgi:hypothetical protein